MHVHRSVGTAIALLGGLALAVVVVGQPSLSPPAGPVAESGRFGLGTALSAANTPGDADSFYKITQPGTYYLTHNLSVTNDGAAIEIASDDVVLDLQGFRLLASVGFGGSPDTDYGVYTESTNVVIRNGTVRRFRLSGIGAFNAAATRVENVQAIDNGTSGQPINPGTGLNLGEGAAVVRCTAHDNSLNGIVVGPGSSVIDSVAYANGNIGIDLDTGSAVIQCVASNNGGTGIIARDSLVAHCTALNNSPANIDIGTTSSTLVGNHAP